ncbi:MAG: hypothetical protein Q9162_003746 [Coniocarpon cinnabarinum]
MATPLSPRSESALNIASGPLSPDRSAKSLSPPKHRGPDVNIAMASSVISSPFQTEVGTDIGHEGLRLDLTPQSVAKSSSRKHASPRFSIYEDHPVATPPLPPSDIASTAPTHFSSLSSDSSPCKVPLPQSSPFKELPDEPTPPRSARQQKNGIPLRMDEDEADKSFASDDTGFTAFSAVPDMTLFAQLGQRTPTRNGLSPRKHEHTPSTRVFMTPATSQSQHERSRRTGSPTPRAGYRKGSGDTTSLLLDFTQPWDGTPRASSPRKTTTEPNLLQHINNQRMPSPSRNKPRTPGRQSMLNLLDFDLPPQPTPRSIPTVTVRELESLKSQYLSEISSLKASLSGREAEVTSLKKAVGDAERRVGEAEESLRDQRSAREHAEHLREEWEKKGKEVETALRKFKEEFIAEEKEKEELLQKLEEANQARQEAELKAGEATRNAAAAQSGFDGKSSNSDAMEAMVAQRVASQLDEKMENLARDLHQVYKKKHESKVASLKKNYEIRAEKKCAELQTCIDELVKQNDELQAVRESSLSIELPNGTKTSSIPEESKRLLEEQKSQLQQHEATIAGLREEMSSVQKGHASLLHDLEQERIEKGELVAAVDEMLALQAEAPATPQQTAIVEDFRKSISGTSRPGNNAGLGTLRTPAGASGLRAPSGLPGRGMGKSTMRSNIERMR